MADLLTEVAKWDKVIVAFSGGKDSIACVLAAIDAGIPRDKMELWHGEVDGREGAAFMDWPITPAYCRAFAAAFGIPIYFSWKKGGFEREMLRENQRTAPTSFEDGTGGVITMGGTRGKLSTRRKFPQVGADLKTRWCSAYLKIDVMSMAIRNMPRLRGLNICVVTGERAEESKSRAKYKTVEIHRAAGPGRKVLHVRPIHGWSEDRVWGIIGKHRIRVHPCYYMGWGRCSCMFCIFGNKNQFASAAVCSPSGAQKLVNYENEFQQTIKRNIPIDTLIGQGTPYEAITPELIAMSQSTEYTLPIVMEPGQWLLPAGAYGESCGPV